MYAFETIALWVFLMGIIYESSLSFYCHKVALFLFYFSEENQRLKEQTEFGVEIPGEI